MEKKKCPFRKSYVDTNCSAILEDFQQCIGEECMAYGFIEIDKSITKDGEKHIEKVEWCRLMK